MELQQFLSLWSSVYNGERVKAPIFNPREIDEFAQPLDKIDPAKLKRATKFPARLYDLWNSKAKLPERFSRMYEGPEEIVTQEPRGEPLSFADLVASKSYKFKFSAVQIESMYQDFVKSGLHISRMNALIAHFWTCVNRARKSDYARLFQVVGIKRRLSAEKDFNDHFESNNVRQALGHNHASRTRVITEKYTGSPTFEYYNARVKNQHSTPFHVKVGKTAPPRVPKSSDNANRPPLLEIPAVTLNSQVIQKADSVVRPSCSQNQSTNDASIDPQLLDEEYLDGLQVHSPGEESELQNIIIPPSIPSVGNSSEESEDSEDILEKKCVTGVDSENGAELFFEMANDSQPKESFQSADEFILFCSTINVVLNRGFERAWMQYQKNNLFGTIKNHCMSGNSRDDPTYY